MALAQAGVKVTVIEAADTVGGGSRTKELTLPGFRHDVCSAVHPLGAGSPFFRSLPLEQYGLRWVHPEIAMAHPFEGGTAAVLHRSLDETARGLGVDGDAYRRLMRPFSDYWDKLAPAILGPVQRIPKSPILMAKFGFAAMRTATGLASSAFKDEKTRAMFVGIAAHANIRLDRPFAASFGLVLGSAAHAVGWPVAEGGSQAISDALTKYLCSLGGEVITGRRVESLDNIDASSAVVFDVTPRQLDSIAGPALSEGYRKGLAKFRYGAGVFKVDYALDAPIPWMADACRRAGTVHIGPTMEDIHLSELAVARGRHPEKPYVLVTQPSLADPTRAPARNHVAWAYCHVPNGSTEDMTQRIEAQIERFAPGFRDIILARHVMGSQALSQYNENYVGGDIAAGAHDGLQLLFRPVMRLSPYRTSNPRIFICSASTPPGAGVHGMCGFHAAQAVLAARQP